MKNKEKLPLMGEETKEIEQLIDSGPEKKIKIIHDETGKIKKLSLG